MMTTDLLAIPSGVLASMLATVEGVLQRIESRTSSCRTPAEGKAPPQCATSQEAIMAKKGTKKGGRGC